MGNVCSPANHMDASSSGSKSTKQHSTTTVQQFKKPNLSKNRSGTRSKVFRSVEKAQSASQIKRFQDLKAANNKKSKDELPSYHCKKKTWKFNHNLKDRPARLNLDSIEQWDDVIGLEKVSEHVCILELVDQSALVVKSKSDTDFIEAFLCQLGRELGVNLPQVSVMSALSGTAQQLIQRVGQFSNLSSISIHEHLLVFQYVQGKRYDPDTVHWSDHLAEMLGKIVAFDLFINNTKRLPFFWSGTNKSLAFVKQEVFGLQNRNRPLSGHDLFSHMRAVRTLLHSDDFGDKFSDTMVEFLSGIDQDRSAQVYQGFNRFLKELSKFKKDEFSHKLAKIVGNFENDFPDMDLFSLNLQTEFLLKMQQNIQEVYQEH